MSTVAKNNDRVNDDYSIERIHVAQLDDMLGQATPVLDHGFVRLIDYMGDDSSIVQAARVSYGRGTKHKSQDQGLINYLMRHRHTTPFEMCEIKLHVKLPIFVARQWIRHRSANVNEYSARYSILDREYYVPQAQHMAAQSQENNQGRGQVLNHEQAKQVQDILHDDAQRCYDNYQHLLNEDAQGNVRDDNHPGLARELARMNLTVNYYTQWYWKIDLHNLLHFLSLRADSHAQYEIRAYCAVILDIVEKWVPFAHEAFMKYRMNGMHLSQEGKNVIAQLLRGENVTQENCAMGIREWDELWRGLGMTPDQVKLNKNDKSIKLL